MSKLSFIIPKVISDPLESSIQDLKNFNLQFLLIVLLLITLTLGVSWILLLIKDDREVSFGHKFAEMKMVLSNVPFEVVDRNVKMKRMLIAEHFSN